LVQHNPHPRLRKSDIAAAIRYALSRWQALNRYVEDGTLAIDNNAVERTIRPLAPGRKTGCSQARIPAASAPLPSTA
jgi:hypothetical protein